MCGRYTLSTPPEELLEIFEAGGGAFEHRPRYNIAPTQSAPVVAEDGEGRKLGLLRWGLVPSWADDPGIGSRLINARSETVSEKPAFRAAFRRRRCLVPADGFYEWSRIEGRKVPWWIHRPDRRPFAMAGLWERWEPPDESSPLYTFTILTREAIPEIRSLHDRMPLVLPPGSWDLWLDPGRGPDELSPVLRAVPGHALEAFQVSTRVNSPSNDDPACVEPVDGGARPGEA